MLGTTRRIDVLTRNVGDGWWAECIRLFAATGDATPILRACIDKRPLDPEALALALQSIEEAERKEPSVKEELDRIIEAGLNEGDPERRRPVAEALLKVRLSRMRRLDEDRYVDPGFVSHAEYQLFLDERRARDEDRRPIHWTTERFPPSQGSRPIIGISFEDAQAFCEWLSEREGGQWRFRLPTIHEGGAAASDSGSVDVAAWALDRTGLPAAWPPVIEARQKAIALKGVKGQAVLLLRVISSSNVPSNAPRI